jgi:hypothetical protein
MTYQQRAAIQAFKQCAYSLGALALGHGKSAALHAASATAWMALSTYVAGAVKAGLVQQWFVDSLWVEPVDEMEYGPADEETN